MNISNNALFIELEFQIRLLINHGVQVQVGFSSLLCSLLRHLLLCQICCYFTYAEVVYSGLTRERYSTNEELGYCDDILQKGMLKLRITMAKSRNLLERTADNNTWR